MEQMNTEELLKQVNTAIRTVLIGGQSYQIGSRKTDQSRPVTSATDAEGTSGRSERAGGIWTSG